ncbi:alpha-glucosidase family protein [Aurantimonas sp. VKM B-3413]|uniref:alpha-glucosidase family protein n=1 Tax=Aurantimonas sp. VKM B-3413 TaxID=2779401 RepID=UPI001E2CBF86|nr:alpha-glucosidase family protein [Aurantimonas sp. VKM B-3413]MCB8837616.1 alpha-glucosidase family protein [Aurantimonas sp. VKM B-3413]
METRLQDRPDPFDARPGENSHGDAEWWRGGVIYQIYPRSYQDSSGDGIGDLAGITRRLAYVASLGVDAIWISPFMPSPMKDFGYDISDYRGVDPIFGTLEDFDALVAEAHRLGLKVVIDQVLSHTSDRHPWFVESRSGRDNAKADWYVWADPKPDGTPPNNWLSVFGGTSWEWDSRRRQYYLHNFLTSQPDLNFHNPAVREALLSDVRFWLDRGVDGFRLDTTNFYFHDAKLRDNPPLGTALQSEVMASRNQPYNFQDHVHDKNRPEVNVFLRELRALLDEYGAMAVGEVGERIRGVELMGEYASGGDKLQMCYAFDFLSGEMPPAETIRGILGRFERTAADGWACWAFSNHDVPRHASRWSGGSAETERILRLAAGILLTIRGSVCLYQGEELGLTEADIAYEDIVDPYGINFWPEVKGRDGARTPMVWEADAPNGGFSKARPWLAVPPEHLSRAVDRMEADPASLLHFYRALLAFRRANPPLVRGAMRFIEAPAEVLAFVRKAGNEALVCAFNLGATEAVLDLAGEGSPTALAGHGFAGRAEGQRISIPPHDGFIGQL